MPTLPLPISSLLGLLGPASGKSAPPASDNFSALLDIGSPDPQAPEPPPRDSEIAKLPAAPIDVPNPILSVAPPRPPLDIKPAKSASAPRQPDPKPQAPEHASAAPAQNAPKASAAKTDDTAASSSASQSQDEQEPPAKKPAQNTNDLSMLAALLNGILQAIGQPAAAAAATPASSGPAPTAVLPTGIQPAFIPASTPASPAPLSASNDPADTASSTQTPAALLADIQALLQQMQQAAPGDQPNLPDLTKALKADVAQLLQLTKAQPTDNSTALPATATTPQADLKSLFASALSLIGNQLQKLHSITQAPDKTLSTNQATLDLTPDISAHNDNAAPATKNTDVPVMPAPSSAAAQPAPIVDTTPFAQPIAIVGAALPGAALDLSQNDTNSSGNDNQQQSLPQPVTGTAAAAPQSAAGANASVFSRLLNQAAPLPVREQIMFQIKTAVADGSSKIRIQLDPAELGKLDIRLTVGADGKTGVSIIADNKNTLNMLQQDAHGLSRALADAGLSTDSGSLSFNLRGGQPDSGGQGQGQSSHAALTYLQAQPEPEEELPIHTIVRNYTLDLAEGLDIKI